MRKKAAVSVIVPVYNVEPYLARCLDTVTAQTLENLEIILVDDGSTDHSGEICDDYQTRYPEKVRVIHQENQGLGPARNAGLLAAEGEYIGFIDSDDWISVEMYEKLYQFAESGQYDVVFSDLFYVNAAASTITKSSMYDSDIPCTVTGEEALLGGVYCYVVNKLFRAELIRGKCFPKLVFEDIPVITKVLIESRKTGYLPEAFYFYERKPGTLSTSFQSASMLDTIQVENMALEDIDAKSREILLYIFAKRFLANISSERKVLKADLVEHMQCYREELRENAYIREDADARRVYQYLEKETLPKNLYYANFEGREYEPFEEACIESFHRMTRGFGIVELNRENCEVEKAPVWVREALKEGNYEYVNEYYKLKSIYENGGIAISPRIYLTAPVGELRMEHSFFGYENKSELLPDIYGAPPGTKLFGLLLASYENYTEETEDFRTMLTRLLTNQYGFSGRGWGQMLRDKIRIFKCDVLACDMQSGVNLAKVLTPESYALLETEYEITDKSILKYWSEDKASFFRQKEEMRKKMENPQIRNEENARLQKQLNEAYQEIAMYKNSRSWKVTEPLRRLYGILHKE